MVNPTSKTAVWLTPLPAETALAAIIGAIISTILAYNQVFSLSSTADLMAAMHLVIQVLIFGVAIHFLCAALILRNSNYIFGFSSLIVILFFSILLIDLRSNQESSIGRFDFSINLANVLLAMVMLAWLILLIIIAEIHRRIES